MTDIIQELINRAPRYELRKEDEISVLVERDGESGLETTDAQLIDISTGGAKLRTSGSIPVLDVVLLELKVKRMKRTLTVSGTICWTTPTSNGEWWIGCQFQPPMPEETLQEFAEGGILERREHRRDETWLRTDAKFELLNDLSAVWIMNFSRGGFCALSDAKGNPGERVELRLEPDRNVQISVRAKVQWQVETNEGYVLGCEFLNPKDYSILQDVHHSRMPSRDGKSWFGRLLGRMFGD